jgi:hypothetical protein
MFPRALDLPGSPQGIVLDIFRYIAKISVGFGKQLLFFWGLVLEHNWVKFDIFIKSYYSVESVD